MNILKTVNVVSGYDGFDVLNGINTEIKSGDFISIIGPNGAGKSTFLKTLAGLIKPSTGEVYYRDKIIDKYSQMELAMEMAMVPQFLESILPFSVREFVATGRFPFQNFWEGESTDDLESIEYAIEKTDTADLRNRTLTELSGGELQLVCIARALAQSKKLIFLDEPVSSLDIKHSIRVMDVLHDLNESGATIITVLHDINIASDYCSKIMAFKKGSVFFYGDAGTVVSEKNITELFKIKCSVKQNPETGRPYVYPRPGYTNQ